MRWTIASTTKTCFVKLECFHRAFFVWYLLVEMLGVVLPMNSVRLTHLRGAIQGIKKTGSPETRPLWAGSSKGLSMTGRSFASDFFLTLLIDWLVVEPTPLKNMSQMGWWHSQLPNWMEKYKPCSKPPTSEVATIVCIVKESDIHSIMGKLWWFTNLKCGHFGMIPLK